MGERKGTNKYYPPDFDPAKHFSLAGYHNQHPLRERARKLKSHGILVIRFEMPYNIWCDGCNSHVGMGVRYNAEKSKVGMYYTTPIWKFRMKCALCDNHYEIQTDPANQDYVIVSGARRKEQRWDPVENEQVVPEDRETHKKLETDPMYKLEHGTDDKAKVGVAVPTLARIEQIQSQWKDDFKINQLARQKFRAEKKSLLAAERADRTLLDKASLDVALVPEDERDIKLAGLLRYGSVVRREEASRDDKSGLDSVGWFGAAAAAGTPAAGGANKLVKLAELRSLAKSARQASAMGGGGANGGGGGSLALAAFVRSRSKTCDGSEVTVAADRAASLPGVSLDSAGAVSLEGGEACDKAALCAHADAAAPPRAEAVPAVSKDASGQLSASLCNYSDSDASSSSSSS